MGQELEDTVVKLLCIFPWSHWEGLEELLALNAENTHGLNVLT